MKDDKKYNLRPKHKVLAIRGQQCIQTSRWQLYHRLKRFNSMHNSKGNFPRNIRLQIHGMTTITDIDRNRKVVTLTKFIHLLQQKFPFWQLPEKSVMKFSSKGQQFRFSDPISSMASDTQSGSMHTYGAAIKWSNFSQNIHKTPHSSPVRARYGVSFVGSDSNWYPSSVHAVMCAISYYTGPRYIGTRLYYLRSHCSRNSY